MTMKFGVSQSMKRIEDDGLLRGAGHYVSDHAPAHTLHAVVLRSPHAHAKFTITDVATAKAMPGVKLILTAEDTKELGNMPCMGMPPGMQIDVPPYPIIATDTVRHVGDIVAFIVADTVDLAKDASEAIVIDYRPLPHVVDATAALKQGAPQIWGDKAGNLAFDYKLGDEAKTAAAFKTAAKIITLTIHNQRLVTNYLDTRAVVAEYEPEHDRVMLTLGSQGSHRVRDVTAGILKIAPEKLRVVTPDVGGGFGTKLFPFREYPIAALAVQKLKRPVKWVADRTEHFLGDSQGRDNLTTAKLALDDKGKFLAFHVETVADMGAYLNFFGPFIPTGGASMLPGLYDFPTGFVRVYGAYTNTVPVDAYRGAGRPEAAYVIERLVDVAARDLDVAPDALRKKNFIKPKAMPYQTPTGRTYDSGEFAEHMMQAQKVGDWAGFKARLNTSKKAKRMRGIGIATYIEACGSLGPETAKVTLDADGGVTLVVGSQSTGQGHKTAYAQLISEHLGIPLDQVRVHQGDTAMMATGKGTGGSSSIPSAGHSVQGASRKLSDQLKALAADALEAGIGDLEMVDGASAVRVAGTDRSVSFADLAQRAPDKSQLMADDAFVPKAPTFPNGTHLAEVEIDPDTGTTSIVNYVIVDDFGMTLNPLLLEGQVIGGVVQGIGQAMMENTVYDQDSGQLVTATLMDYALPRADDVPDFHFETRHVPCRVNPMGVKGAGEAGTIGSAPAVMNAIVDALWRAHRIRHIDMPATPQRVWAAIEEAKRLHTM